MDLKKFIRDVPDFPQKGILFRDITPLLQNSQAFSFALEQMLKSLDLNQVDYFAGVESRGFIFASALASKTGKGFLPLRKAGKLPPPVVQTSYKLEYGEASLELAHRGAQDKARVVIIDDVLATGGTLVGALELCQKAGYEVHSMAVLINLTFLNQLKYKNQEIHSVVQY